MVCADDTAAMATRFAAGGARSPWEQVQAPDARKLVTIVGRVRKGRLGQRTNGWGNERKGKRMRAPVASVCRVVSSREAPSRQHPVVGGREMESEANVRTRMRQAQGRREFRAAEDQCVDNPRAAERRAVVDGLAPEKLRADG